MKNKYSNQYGNKKLSQDTGPDRKLLKKVNALRTRLETYLSKLSNILNDGVDLEYVEEAHRKVVKFQTKIIANKKLTKEEFEFMNHIHEQLKISGD